MRITTALAAVLLVGGCAPDIPGAATATDPEALRIGRGVLGIQAAIDDPAAPGSLAAVRELGLDSRYYTLVRGWLGQELAGLRSIADARQPESLPDDLQLRIAFLREAIRAIDLE